MSLFNWSTNLDLHQNPYPAGRMLLLSLFVDKQGDNTVGNYPFDNTPHFNTTFRLLQYGKV